ncbi:MAG: hypothetical protein COA78_08755 [Blastopirellula sp.]|nr:MAG: hypothetical protein COA78_08755 [Blastopirellula sp.]
MNNRHSFALLLLLCCLFFSPHQVSARPWTDSNGNRIDAKFVRYNNGQVTLLTKSGKRHTLPITKLSLQDQEYIKEVNTSLGIRDWTDSNGQQFTAKFIRIQGTTVYLVNEGKTQEFEFSKFSDAEQQWIRARTVELGVDTQLPEINNTKTNRITELEERPKISENSRLIINNEIKTDINNETPRRRIWTDRAGNRMEAYFVNILENSIVQIKIGSTTVERHVSRLSDDDRDYLRSHLKDDPRLKFVPLKVVHLNSSTEINSEVLRNSNSTIENTEQSFAKFENAIKRCQTCGEYFGSDRNGSGDCSRCRDLKSQNIEIEVVFHKEIYKNCQTCGKQLTTDNQLSGECYRCRDHRYGSYIKPYTESLKKYSFLILLIATGLGRLFWPRSSES